MRSVSETDLIVVFGFTRPGRYHTRLGQKTTMRSVSETASMSAFQTDKLRSNLRSAEKIPREAGLEYVLITPARNEEQFIEQTIQSVVSQTTPPRKWVIVSDGSTDRTDEIVRKYVDQYSWLTL